VLTVSLEKWNESAPLEAAVSLVSNVPHVKAPPIIAFFARRFPRLWRCGLPTRIFALDLTFLRGWSHQKTSTVSVSARYIDQSRP
jgi:hypothetical protein